MKWTETPIQVKGYLKRRDIIKWKIDYREREKEKQWTIFTKNDKPWIWLQKDVEY